MKFLDLPCSRPAGDTGSYTFTAVPVQMGYKQNDYTQLLLPEEETLTGKKIATHGAYALYSKKHNIEEDE